MTSAAGFAARTALAVIFLAGCRTPTGPTTRPAAGQTAPSLPLSARQVRFSIERLGSVAHDTFTPPVCSPDGRYIAVQVESAASMEFRIGLATTSQKRTQAPGTNHGTVVVFDISGPAPVEVRRVGPDVFLGREAVAGGFLIQEANGDGSADLGVLPWIGAGADWFAADGAWNALTAAGPDGSIAWSRRSLGSDTVDIVVQSPDGSRTTIDAPSGSALLAPTFSTDGSQLAWLRFNDGVLDWTCRRVEPAQSGVPRIGQAAAVTVGLSDRATSRAAFQAIVPLAAAVRWGTSEFLLADPGIGRLVIMPGITGKRRLLPPGTRAAIQLADGRALVLQGGRLSLGSDPSANPTAWTVVLDGDWAPLPQACDGSTILFRADGASLQLARLRIESEARSSSSSSTSNSSSSSSS